MEDTETATRFAQLERSMRRRFRLVTGALLAVILVVNVAPVAADHLVVRSSDIVDGAVNTPDLRNRSVGTAKLKNGSVGTHKLKNGSVGTKKLKDKAVNTPDLRNGAVGTHKLKNGAVGTKKLKNGAVGPAKLSSNVLPARGYARVHSGGSILAGRNISGDNITRASTGIYCFHDLPFQPVLAVATSYTNNVGRLAVYQHNRATTLCPSDTQFAIFIRRSDTGGFVNDEFNIVVM